MDNLFCLLLQDPRSKRTQTLLKSESWLSASIYDPFFKNIIFLT